MRVPRRTPIVRILAAAAVAIVLLFWWRERNAGAELERRLADLRHRQRELPTPRSAPSHSDAQPAAFSSEKIAPLPSTDRGASRSRSEPAVPTFAIGEWKSADSWKNEGRSTPRAAITTLLWAAAGGDLGTIRNILEFDDDTRARAQDWFDKLPPATRQVYATPENLVAGVTTSTIAPTAAQLIWDHQADDDYAIIGLLLAREPPPAPAGHTPAVAPANPSEPPTTRKTNPNRLAVLTLHRGPTGWRVLVPAAAIDEMAKSLYAAGQGR